MTMFGVKRPGVENPTGPMPGVVVVECQALNAQVPPNTRVPCLDPAEKVDCLPARPKNKLGKERLGTSV